MYFIRHTTIAQSDTEKSYIYMLIKRTFKNGLCTENCAPKSPLGSQGASKFLLKLSLFFEDNARHSSQGTQCPNYAWLALQFHR